MVQLIPKKQPKPIFGQIFFVIISLALLVGIGTTYFVLGDLIIAEQEERNRLDEIFTQDTRPEEEKLSKELEQYQDQIEKLKVVIDERNYYNRFFDILERYTHPDVYFTSLAGDAEKGEFALSGEAANFIVLEQQRLVWKNLDIADVRMEDIALGKEGRSLFNVHFDISPDILDFK